MIDELASRLKSDEHLAHLQIPPCCVRAWRSNDCFCTKLFPHCEQICSIGGLNVSATVAILNLDVLPCSFHWDRVTRLRNTVRCLLLYPSKGVCSHSDIHSNWKHISTATCCILWCIWRGLPTTCVFFDSVWLYGHNCIITTCSLRHVPCLMKTESIEHIPTHVLFVQFFRWPLIF